MKKDYTDHGWCSLFKRVACQFQCGLGLLNPRRFAVPLAFAWPEQWQCKKGLSCLRFAAKGGNGERRIAVRRAAGLLLLAVGLLLLALPGRPVESLLLQRGQGPETRLALPLGRAFVTVYEHSVERTPVQDVYYAVGGRICPWQTRTRSHNAGLPGPASDRCRFLSEDSWLVMEGGHPPLDEVRLRVGDALLGRNELFIRGGEYLNLYTLFPGERVVVLLERQLLYAVWQQWMAQ